MVSNFHILFAVDTGPIGSILNGPKPLRSRGEAMPTKKTLEDRRRALEESFFQKENDKLLARLRATKERVAAREALAREIRLEDEDILDHLIDVGIRAETWLAVSLVPLVEVAWANRVMDRNERAAILGAAAEHGIEENSDASQLLSSWLAHRPSPKLRQAWAEYMEVATRSLSDSARNAIREKILQQSRAIAATAGGFLGLLSPISEAEERLLEELAVAF